LNLLLYDFNIVQYFHQTAVKKVTSCKLILFKPESIIKTKSIASDHDPQEVIESTKKQSTNASNTPTLTRKAGREIKARALAQQQTNREQRNSHNMAAKSAGTGTLTRSNGNSSPPTHPSLNKVSFKTKESRTSGTRRTSEDRAAAKSNANRPQSPVYKLNESQQPAIMLESVQKQIQKEEEQKMNEKSQTKEKGGDDVDAFTEQEEKANCSMDEEGSAAHAITNTTSSSNKDTIQSDHPPESINLKPVTTEVLKKQRVDEDNKENLSGRRSCSVQESTKDVNRNQTQVQSSSTPPSPPVTPAATVTSIPEFSHPIIIRDDKGTVRDAAGMSNPDGESASPTMCTFDAQSVQQHSINNTNEFYEIEKQHSNGSNFYVQQQQQQPIQRIQRLRSAASFATLRQLASINCNHQQQGAHQKQQQQNQIQQIKRRPVSFIEPSSYSHYNYAMASIGSVPLPSDDYLSVHRPTYYRRASSDDNRNFHSRRQSDNTTIQFTNPSASPPASSAASPQIGARRIVRSNTVHNLIIKDGQGHRIVQCVGLDDGPPLQPQQLRRQTSNYESNNDIMYLQQQQQQQQQFNDWSPPPEIIDDTSAILLSRQQVEELQLQQQLLLQHHQNSSMVAVAPAAAVTQQQENTNTDASSSDSSSQHGSNGAGRNTSGANRKMRRKDSAKSLSSLCSSSPPMTGYDANCELLKAKLEKERATVKALQKQKEGLFDVSITENKCTDVLTLLL
jgi:hypothetical protein